jgi:elongation factor Ts
MEITAAMVKAFREKTGLSMMDCKNALVEAKGDEALAIEILRKAGKGRVEKMATREASEGRIACFVDGKAKRGGIVELRCETAPVANTEDFIALANLIARIAAGLDNPTPDSVRAAKLPEKPGTVADHMTDIFNRIRENLQIARVASLSGHLAQYVHHNGRVGVLCELSADGAGEIGTDVCMQIAAMRPRCVRREEVPAAEVQRERQEAAAAAQGKPPPVVEKIVAGKLDRWFSEFVLLEQGFVKADGKMSVAQALKAVAPQLTVNRFLRYELGVTE